MAAKIGTRRQIELTNSIERQPTMLLVAGPNGAGKSTFAREHLARSHYGADIPFVNADDVAASLSPSDIASAAIDAGRKTLEEIRGRIERAEDFAIETTLSGRHYLNLVRDLKSKGWLIRLVYVWVATPDLAKSRVADRVQAGGHNIPPDDIERRYFRSMQNLINFIPLCDEVTIYDNSSLDPSEVAALKDGTWIVNDPSIFVELKLK